MSDERSRLAAAVAVVLFGAAGTSWAQALPTFDLPDQPLAVSLRALGSQTNTNVLVAPELVDGRAAPELKGQMSLDAALTHLLAGTPLRHKFINDGTIVVTAAKPASDKQTNTSGELQSDRWGRLRLAQVDSPAMSSSTASGAANLDAAASRTQSLEEVIVTAQKRNERLQEVPVPVTAIDAASLVDTNQLRLQDYYTRSPGVSLTIADGVGAPQVTIRGITTGGNTNPTVGIVVDDVPYGSSTVLGGGWILPDFDPSDLARVEVLRGPQGTLYGASSLGGLLKYVTERPSMNGFKGRVQLGISGSDASSDVGGSARGSVNVPINETLAIRASGFTRRDPGYVDNVQTGEKDVNSARVSGGRLSALWQPTGEVSVLVSAMHQDNDLEGSPIVHSNLRDLQQSTLRRTGFFDNTLDVMSAQMEAQIGSVTLTSVTGYSVNEYLNVFDYTAIYGAQNQNVFGVRGSPLYNYNETTKFTQELRLSVPLSDRVAWLIGAFYADEDSESIQEVFAANQSSGALAGSSLKVDFPTTYRELAAFTNLTVQMTDRFDVQLGARQSRTEQTYQPVRIGPFVPIFYGLPSPVISPRSEPEDDAFTYLVTPRFRISPDLMLYARVASGFRAGGPNTNATLNTVPTYEPDTTDNYEIGAKGSWFDGRMSFDASVFHIDWQDMQLQVFNPALGRSVYSNASRARSDGVELSVEVKPTDALTVSSWVSWNDAVLSEALPPGPAYGRSGDRLPITPRFSANLSLRQDFALPMSMTGFVAASASYVGDRQGVFTATAAQVRQEFDAYVRADLQAGVTLNAWSVNLFVNNFTDERGVLLGDPAIAAASYYIQPRSYGVAVTRSW